jgi:hypothetical protein
MGKKITLLFCDLHIFVRRKMKRKVGSRSEEREGEEGE